MRRKRTGARPKGSKAPWDPLAEGLRTTKRGRRWTELSDDDVVAFAKRTIEEGGIRNRNGLIRADSGLYHVLRKRGLLERIGLGKAHRDWSSMEEEELMRFAQEAVRGMGLRHRRELQKKDCGLYAAIQRRGLLHRIEFGDDRRSWSRMTDGSILEEARRLILENGIRSRTGLLRADRGLYVALVKRKLLERIGLAKRNRDWASMTDHEVVSYAKRVIREQGILSRKDMAKADTSLYQTLCKRRLLDSAGLTKSFRDLSLMSDEELIGLAKDIIEREGLVTRKQLWRSDQSLYNTLKKRELMGMAFPELPRSEEEALRQVMGALSEF